MDWRKKQLEKASGVEEVEIPPARGEGSDQESSDSEDDSPPRQVSLILDNEDSGPD